MDVKNIFFLENGVMPLKKCQEFHLFWHEWLPQHYDSILNKTITAEEKAKNSKNVAGIFRMLMEIQLHA
jgi:hypothetical protein